MNRRDALQELTEPGLPRLSSVSVVTMSPDDVIVVECDEPLTKATEDNLLAALKRIWPSNQTKIIVLNSGYRLKVETRQALKC